MTVRKAGRRRATGSSIGFPQMYDYVSPKVSFECEKLSEEELKALSSDVKTYTLKELEEQKRIS